MRALLFAALAAAACTANPGAGPADELAEIDGVYRAALDDAPCADEDDDVRAARVAISRVRALAGLPALRCDRAAAVAAVGHCRYVIEHGELTHVQERGRKGFTGVSFEDRLRSAGFSEDPGGEVLANITGREAITSPAGFVNSVYHRALFLRSELTSFGYGRVGACATIDFGRDTKRADVTVVWPPPGTYNAPTTFFSSRETPNPVPGSTLVGAPISLVRQKPLPRLTATLEGPGGPIASVLLTAGNDPHKLIRPGEAHLVPRAPLAPRTTYRARFGDVADTTFTTGD